MPDIPTLSQTPTFWTLSSRFMEREIRFDPAVGLYTTRWLHKLTGNDFMAETRQHVHPEFFFNVDGVRVSSLSGAWELLRAEWTQSPAETTLRVGLRAQSPQIDVAVCYTLYADYPALRKRIAVTNCGLVPLTLTRLCFENAPLLVGDPAEIQVSAFYGVMPRELLFTGRVEDAMLTQQNLRTGEGFAVLNEAPGYLKRTESSPLWEGGMSLMYDTDLFPFERQLAANETFTSARGCTVFFVQDRGASDLRVIMPAFTAAVLLKKGSAYQPPWIYNTWEPFHFNVNRRLIDELVPVAARMGMDIFTIDDGWQLEYGDNTIHPERFPGGLDGVQANVEKYGMRLGLWAPLAVVGADTPAAVEHPEWICTEANQARKITKTAGGIKVVMCLASPYRDLAAQRISALIGRYNLKYVKLDLTTMFNTYGEMPGCHAPGHDHATWAESLARIYEGVKYVCDCIYAVHPDVLLDLTYELWGHKHVIDYGLLAAGDLDWLSNVHDARPGRAGPRQARLLLYHRALAIPTEAMLIGNLEVNTAPIEERFATAIGAGPLLLGDLRKLTDAEQDWYGHKIRWFKQFRREAPIHESFFPLGNWMQPGPLHWDGYARLSRRGEGIIALFRNDSAAGQIALELPFMPDARYEIRAIMSGRSLGAFDAERLRGGIVVGWEPGAKVEILECRVSSER